MSFIHLPFQRIFGNGQQPGNPRRWLRRHARRVRIPGRRNVSCDLSVHAQVSSVLHDLLCFCWSAECLVAPWLSIHLISPHTKNGIRSGNWGFQTIPTTIEMRNEDGRGLGRLYENAEKGDRLLRIVKEKGY